MLKSGRRRASLTWRDSRAEGGIVPRVKSYPPQAPGSHMRASRTSEGKAATKVISDRLTKITPDPVQVPYEVL